MIEAFICVRVTQSYEPKGLCLDGGEHPSLQDSLAGIERDVEPRDASVGRG